jgi:hypothetical protein
MRQNLSAIYGNKTLSKSVISELIIKVHTVCAYVHILAYLLRAIIFISLVSRAHNKFHHREPKRLLFFRELHFMMWRECKFELFCNQGRTLTLVRFY